MKTDRLLLDDLQQATVLQKMSDTALCSNARFDLVEEKSYESALLPLRSRRELVLTAKSSVLVITDLLRLPAGPSGDNLSDDAWLGRERSELVGAIAFLPNAMSMGIEPPCNQYLNNCN